MTHLEKIFYYIRDYKDQPLNKKGLQMILDSNDSELNYRCVTEILLHDSRIPPAHRPTYVIRHAKIFFENLDYNLIVRFLNKVYSKPAYQKFISSEYVSYYFDKAYQKYSEEQKKKGYVRVPHKFYWL